MCLTNGEISHDVKKNTQHQKMLSLNLYSLILPHPEKDVTINSLTAKQRPKRYKISKINAKELGNTTLKQIKTTAVTIPLRPAPLHQLLQTISIFLAGDHLVVPIEVSHISLRHKKYNQGSGRK